MNQYATECPVDLDLAPLHLKLHWHAKLIYFSIILTAQVLTGGIRPYAPRHVQYDTWYEGILCGK
eukprot:COSAG06_NODE_1996_length_7886_cov_6.036985_1_plen_65_part_00